MGRCLAFVKRFALGLVILFATFCASFIAESKVLGFGASFNTGISGVSRLIKGAGRKTGGVSFKASVSHLNQD